MKNIFLIGVVVLSIFDLCSCSNNKAADMPVRNKSREASTSAAIARVKEDGPVPDSVRMETFTFKLHRAFTYRPSGSELLAGMKPERGFKFIYLDLSLRNTGSENFDASFLMLALKVTGMNGTEYKKPSAALAAYTSDHPEDNNEAEFEALWGTFKPGDFHREIVWAVEVPEDENNFVLHVPEAPRSKVKKPLPFTVQ